MPEIGVRYTSVQTFKADTTYTCASCGFTSPVKVLGIGDASASASHMLGNYASAREAAANSAHARARADVDRMLGLVPCPSCKKRLGSAVARFWIGQALKVGGILALVSLGVLFIFRSASVSTLLIVWGIACALAFGIYVWVIDPRFEWQRASMCVKFPPADPAAESARVLSSLRATIESLASRHKHPPSQEALERVRACEDEDTLRQWAMGAALSQSLDDVLNGN